MVEPIAYAPNQDLGRYLHSLDSVRFAESEFPESDRRAHNVHAHIETFISLLSGQTIPVGEHHFVDSLGFLSSATGLIESRKSLDPFDRRKVEKIFPFRLNIRPEYRTVDELLAAKLGDVYYRLSLWSGISQLDKHEMQRTRNAIKKKIRSGKFQWETDKLVPPEDRIAAELLRKVRDCFRSGEQQETLTLYETPTVSVVGRSGLLQDGLAKIITWTEADLRELVDSQMKIRIEGIELKESFEPELVSPAVELINILKNLHAAEIRDHKGQSIDAFANRSNIRNYRKELAAFIPDDQRFYGILEIYDSLYNSSIAESANAYNEGASIARNVQGNVYLRAGLALSALAVKLLRASPQESPNWVNDIKFEVLEDAKTVSILQNMPWEVIWHAYLSTEWRRSVSQLNKARMERDRFMLASASRVEDSQKVFEELDVAESEHNDVMSKLIANANWKAFRNSENGDFVVQALPETIGVIGATLATYIISHLGIDVTAVPAMFLSLGVGGLAKVSSIIMLPALQKYQTQGYVRKMFGRMNSATGRL